MKNWHFNGKEMDFHSPRIMGIINLTDDSFYGGSRRSGTGAAVRAAGEMIGDGAYILDLGAVSTRPGAHATAAKEEMDRLIPALRAIRKEHPLTIISIDTFRSSIAQAALEEGADIINDISAGRFDRGMEEVILHYHAPYILMHMQGIPETMQTDPQYEDVVREVHSFLEGRTAQLRSLGIDKMIIDPGFGFGKTVSHNFKLLDRLAIFASLGYPLLAGISRKSMINKVIGTNPAQALNGTTVLNTIALMNGANILRVHDIKPAKEAISLTQALKEAKEEMI